MWKRIACGLASVAAVNGLNIVETAQATADLSTLVSVLTTDAYKPVLDTLNGTGPFTVFAPTNAAFAAANLNTSMVELVTATLQYHVLNGAVQSGDLSALQFPPTLSTDAMYVNRGGKGQNVGVAKSADGVVTLDFGTAGTAQVTTADVQCDNGVVHIIDSVLLLPKGVVDTATDASLTQLLAAVTKVNLADTVATTADLTIFAPTDAAFTAANWDTLDDATLTSVLQYHVVPAVAFSSDLTDGQKIPTLGGQELTVTIANGVVKINDATVTKANVLTNNGVVHVIDKVMIPAAGSPTAAAPTPEDSGAAPSAMAAAGLVCLWQAVAYLISF